MSEALQQQGDAGALFPGVSYYQVLTPGALVMQDGSRGYDMVGPFPTLAHANQYAQNKPGALITVTLVLHQAAPFSADLAAKISGLGKAT